MDLGLLNIDCVLSDSLGGCWESWDSQSDSDLWGCAGWGWPPTVVPNTPIPMPSHKQRGELYSAEVYPAAPPDIGYPTDTVDPRLLTHSTEMGQPELSTSYDMCNTGEEQVSVQISYDYDSTRPVLAPNYPSPHTQTASSLLIQSPESFGSYDSFTPDHFYYPASVATPSCGYASAA